MEALWKGKASRGSQIGMRSSFLTIKAGPERNTTELHQVTPWASLDSLELSLREAALLTFQNGLEAHGTGLLVLQARDRACLLCRGQPQWSCTECRLGQEVCEASCAGCSSRCGQVFLGDLSPSRVSYNTSVDLVLSPQGRTVPGWILTRSPKTLFGQSCVSHPKLALETHRALCTPVTQSRGIRAQGAASG